jgi:protein O-GlcNAc transferase
LSSRAPYPELLRQAQSLWRSERPAEARRIVERLLGLSPHDVEALILSAHLAMQAGEPEAAMHAVDLAATLAPESAAVQHTRGRILQARGEPLAALACFQLAARAAPANADVLTSLGNALRGLGRMEESIAAYRQALAAEPGYPPAIANLANVLEALGDLASAGALREAAGQAAISRAIELQRRALEPAAHGRPRAALDLLQDALALAASPETLHVAAELAGDCSDYQLALDYVDRLLAVEPDNAPAVRLGCVLAVGGGLLERLPRYTQRLKSLAPADEVLTLVRLALSPIEESRESIAATRAAYEAVLDELLQSDFRICDPAVLGLVQPFFLAYHGERNRDLHIKAARLYARALPSLLYVSPHCQRSRRRPGKIRIGFISRYFSAHAIGKVSLGLVEKIDRRRFEVYVVRVNPGRDDETTARFRAAADHFVPVSGDLRRLAETHQQLAALELDIISNDLYETADSPAHYSERLVLLHDLPTCSYYYRPPVPSELPRRAALGLP